MHSNIETLEHYRGAHVKIKHQCNICSNIWKAKPNSILNGGGCPQCAIVASQISLKGKRDKSFKEAALNIPCSLYILNSEECIKVGISKNISTRLKGLKYEGFYATLIQSYKLNTWDAIMVEQEVHHKFKRYKSKIKFKGYKELHYKEDLQAIKEYIDGKITKL